MKIWLTPTYLLFLQKYSNVALKVDKNIGNAIKATAVHEKK